MLFVHKTKYLIMCTLASTRVLTHSQDLPDSSTFAEPLCEYSPDSPTFAKLFCKTCQTRQHSPKAIFEKNVTRLAKFARVICESRKFGASSHCLIWSNKLIPLVRDIVDFSKMVLLKLSFFSVWIMLSVFCSVEYLFFKIMCYFKKNYRSDPKMGF
jgi:hypothetical protein